MEHVLIVVSLSLGLVAVSGVASAQENDVPFIVGTIDGTCVTSGAGVGSWTITCGDITPGSGITVIEPPSADAGLAPVDLAPAPVPAFELAPDPAPVDDPATDVPADAVAAETDTDGDGISDDYEINVYATDPGVWDTDGDGLSDGDVLLVTGTDPFVWDTNGDGISDAGIDAAAETAPLVADEGAPVVGEEGASGTPSVDEVNLGTDPLDPASFPTEESPLASA